MPTVVPAASTLSKQEEDRLAMPPPPPPLVATDGSPSSGPVSSVTADDSRQVQSQAPGTSAADGLSLDLFVNTDTSLYVRSATSFSARQF